MNDGFCDISLEYGEAGEFLLIGFDLIEGGDVVDDRVDPGGLNVGDVSGVDLAADVIDVSFVDLFFSEYFGFQLFFLFVGQFLRIFRAFW